MCLVLVVLGLAAAPRTSATTSYGLEWPGDGSVRRMLYWDNPFPIYDATYIFQVYPREKTGEYNYYTTFFWGNNGPFPWDGGQPNTYYGAHPYPVPAPSGSGQWEISVNSNDYVTGVEVTWNRWHTQAFRAWRESSSVTHHEFYYDLPDTSKVITRTITDPSWADRNPPDPSIHMGQAAWGAYPGDEEFDGVIRGIQMYSGLLSLAEIQAEIAAPLSTTAGRNLIWYLNLDPRPSDVTDKKGIGNAHNPSWLGETALEWSMTVSGDADGDGVPVPTDCAPSDPAAFAIPREVEGVSFLGDKVTLSWSSAAAQAGSGTRYDVVRGSIDQLPVGTGPDESCAAFDLVEAALPVALAPPSGAGFYYLVRAVNICGTDGYGTDSEQTPRLTNVCGT